MVSFPYITIHLLFGLEDLFKPNLILNCIPHRMAYIFTHIIPCDKYLSRKKGRKYLSSMCQVLYIWSHKTPRGKQCYILSPPLCRGMNWYSEKGLKAFTVRNWALIYQEQSSNLFLSPHCSDSSLMCVQQQFDQVQTGQDDHLLKNKYFQSLDYQGLVIHALLGKFSTLIML